MDARTQKRVDAAMAAIRSHAGTAKLDGIAADFSGSVGAEVVIAKLPAVDVLVNNVGIFEPKPFTEIPDADCRSTAALWPYKAILLPLNLNPDFRATLLRRARRMPRRRHKQQRML